MNLDWTLVAVNKDLIGRLWAGIDSVNTWAQCMYWMTLENLDNCSEQPPLLPVRAGAPSGNVNFWCWSTMLQQRRHDSYVCARLKAEHREDTGSNGMWTPEGFGLSLSGWAGSMWHTPAASHHSTGLNWPSTLTEEMKVSCFPPLRKQYKVQHNIKQLFHPHHTPLNNLFPSWNVLELKDRSVPLCQSQLTLERW